MGHLEETTSITEWVSLSASNCAEQRPTSVQNRPFSRVFSATRPRKSNRVIETYGAGDGDRIVEQIH
jgi:hypothetical protein